MMVSIAMTPVVRWARLRRPADCGLRVGAWYPVAARVSPLKSDRRLTRRRSFGSRRRTPERRIADRRVLPLLGYQIEQRLAQRRSALPRRYVTDRRSGIERRRRVAAW